MTKWNGRILFIDAFAGPGEYSGGERGSPLIALDALIQHSARARMSGQIRYIFLEKKKDRAIHLDGLLQEMDSELPPNAKWSVHNSAFDETVTGILDDLAEQKKRLAPAFVMIDPFGVSDTPMRTISRILSNPKSEVYISFMYESLNRFRGSHEFEGHLDELFGCIDWRSGIDISDRESRKSYFYGLYRKQLRKSGASYVLHFELYEGDRLVYAIFFGTKNLEGCDKMKRAIWKVAPFGDFRFRGDMVGQIAMSSALEPVPLRPDLIREFGGQGWTKIENMIAFAKSDATAYHSGHLNMKTLRPMENGGEIEVNLSPRKRVGSYPNGTVLRFLQSGS